MIDRKTLFAAVLSCAGLAGSAIALGEDCETHPGLVNDYPTSTRGDYIYGCMQVNGQTRTVLDQCACSIDVIATILPYEEYEEAETVLSVRQRGGENVGFLFNPAMREKVNNLKRAQIEGELRCF